MDDKIKKVGDCSHFWFRNDHEWDGEEVKFYSVCQQCKAKQVEVFSLKTSYELDGGRFREAVGKA
jgi:hypothetical protein